jgi:hypothetical protein
MPRPLSRPASSPARNASPTPVGSAFTVSGTAFTVMAEPALLTISTPFSPSVVIRMPTRDITSCSDQPVFCRSSSHS